jgi:hypothetical protein
MGVEDTGALAERARRAAAEQPRSAAPELARLAEYALQAARSCRWDERKRASYLLAAEGYARAAVRAADTSAPCEAA